MELRTIDTIIKYFKELSDIPLINSLVVLISVYFGFWLNGLARTKKDKKEAKQIFNILHDEIKSNLDNNLNKDSSNEYLSVLGEEILKAKMVILATHYKDPLDNFIKIYRQFININKALSDYNKLDIDEGTLPTDVPGVSRLSPKSEIKIIGLRKLCKANISIYLNKYSKQT